MIGVNDLAFLAILFEPSRNDAALSKRKHLLRIAGAAAEIGQGQIISLAIGGDDAKRPSRIALAMLDRRHLNDNVAAKRGVVELRYAVAPDNSGRQMKEQIDQLAQAQTLQRFG